MTGLAPFQIEVLTVSQMTPGGGGYGKSGEESKIALKEDYEKNWKKGSLANRLADWESSS